MAGSFTYTPGPPPLGRTADLVLAARYVGVSQNDQNNWSVLDNVVPLSVRWSEGPSPPVARFRYVFDPPAFGDQRPFRIEHVFPLDASGPGVLQADDRIGVFRFTDSGGVYILFDGFCVNPQADLSKAGEQASVTAVGVPIREWDTPLVGAKLRQASTPIKPNADMATGLPARFNPEGWPNATPDSKDNPGSYDSTIPDPRPDPPNPTIAFPVFFGPQPPDNEAGSDKLRTWSLDTAVAYILAQANPKMAYVQWDPRNVATLKAMVPKKEGGVVDVDDDTTFNLKPIDVEDIDVTGMCWPEAVERMIAPHGFGLRWRLSIDENLSPTWSINFYRLDGTDALELLLQKSGNSLDPYKTNVQELHLARDGHAVANKVAVDMAPTLVEASFILAPGFAIAAADLNNPEHFVLGDVNCTGDNLDKYRVFVLDESGEGHWDIVTAAMQDAGKDAVADLAPVLNTGAVYGADLPAKGVMAQRRRRPRSPLISLDPDTKEPFRAKLHVSFNYGRTSPGTWDTSAALPGVYDGKSGTWDEVESDCWTLLDDRIGIRITCRDVEEFPCGTREDWKPYTGAFNKVAWPAASNGMLWLLEMLANADNVNGFNVPIFMLTCCVEADTAPKVLADGTKSSPTRFAITRRYDARHRFKKRVVSKFSFLADPANDGPQGKDIAAEDDTDDANAMAQASLRAHQFATFAGSVTIPRLTVAYRVGDRVKKVTGRNISLDQNAGSQDGASPVYPQVASVEWTFEDGQFTVLQLTDRRAEYPAQRQHQRKPRFSKV